jgi:intraflagellar transport protein 46
MLPDITIKPFIPNYIPAIGVVDAFLKLNCPDNQPEELGLIYIDEPTIQGMDSIKSSLELSYKMECKTPNNMLIKAINNANKNPVQLQNWIIEVSDLHKEKISHW